jgi:hypothetical protein
MLADTLRLKLGLNDTEIQILLRLVTWERLAREQVRAIAMCERRPVKIGSVNGIIDRLRKKLAGRGIKLATIREFGFELRQRDRKKILELLARSTTNAAANAPAKPLASPPVHFSREGYTPGTLNGGDHDRPDHHERRAGRGRRQVVYRCHHEWTTDEKTRAIRQRPSG